MDAVTEVPVVNLLSDHAHPMQALADVLTMQQLLGPLAGRTVAWVGDYNNVARSLGEIRALLGTHGRSAVRTAYEPDGAEVERLALSAAARSVDGHRPVEAVTGADAVHADAWVSMGQEAETGPARRRSRGSRSTTP